jgi:hypothetical protein
MAMPWFPDFVGAVDVVVYDPRAGKVHGHRQLRRFVKQNESWLAERRARIDTVASTSAGGRVFRTYCSRQS